MIDPDHPTCSAITVADVSGCSVSNALALASNGVRDVSCGGRLDLGGRSDAHVLSTVDRPILNCLAIYRYGTPSATSCRINAGSFTEIIIPICLVASFSPLAMASFSTVAASPHKGRLLTGASLSYAPKRVARRRKGLKPCPLGRWAYRFCA